MACLIFVSLFAIMFNFQCVGGLSYLAFGPLSSSVAKFVYVAFLWLAALAKGTLVALSLARIYLILKVRGDYYLISLSSS